MEVPVTDSGLLSAEPDGIQLPEPGVNVETSDNLLQTIPVAQLETAHIETETSSDIPVLHVEDSQMELIFGQTIHIIDTAESKEKLLNQIPDVLTFPDENAENVEQLMCQGSVIETLTTDDSINLASDVSVVYVQSEENEEGYKIIEVVNACET